MDSSIPDEFFDPGAPLYQPMRYQHPDCSEGKSRALSITRTERGWMYHCFRCGAKGFKGVSGLSPKGYIKWIKSNKIRPTMPMKTVDLPLDCTTDFPLPGQAWLLKYGITNEDILKHNIYYSPGLDRIILPVYQQGKLIYWQGRTLHEPNKQTNPKYINVFVPRANVCFENRRRTGDLLVFVEDILSAIRVGHTADCIALLTASINDDLIRKWAAQYNRLALWLDPDKRMYVINKIKRYKAFGVPITGILSKKDPKYYSDNEIAEYLHYDEDIVL